MYGIVGFAAENIWGDEQVLNRRGRGELPRRAQRTAFNRKDR
jgi:hypothetical protein